MSQLYQIARMLSEGEMYVIPLLLFLFLVFRKRKIIFGELLISYNFLMLFLIGSYLVYYLFEIYAAWSGTSKYEVDIFFKNRISGGYILSYWLPFIMTLVLFLLLFFKRYRLSPWFAFVIFFFVHLNFWIGQAIIFMSSLYRDYLPSSWRVYYDFSAPVVSIAVFLAVLLLLYFLRKRNAAVTAGNLTSKLLLL
jgi:hypothetical protein